jgi:inward rectifier potassium channel
MASNPDARTFTANPTGRRNHRGEASMSVRVGAYTLTKTGASRYDWRDPYHIAISLGWPGFLAMFVVAELSINVIFALLYLAQPGSIANARPGAFSDAFFFSLETLATVGYGAMSPGTLYGHCISAVEIISGLAFIAIMTGLTFVRFSRARAKILYAEKAVIAQYNGKPTLMIRIANGRASLMVDATARLSALIAERTQEGQYYRRIHDLALSRARLPMFAITWTLMHEIDETSPLRRFDLRRLPDSQLRVFLSVTARDLALAAEVYDMKDYGPNDVVFGMRYADAVSIDEQGNTIADLRRLSLLEEDTGTNFSAAAAA